MRLGIDLSPLTAYPSGIPVVARQIVGGIAVRRPDWALQGFSWGGWRDSRPFLDVPISPAATAAASDANQRLRAKVSNLGLSLPLVSISRLLMRRLRFKTAVRPALDVFYALNFMPPGEIDVPVVPLVHDLFHLMRPDLVHPVRRRALMGLGRIIARAPRVQCVSQSTADDVIHHFGVARGRIDIVAPAVRSHFFTAMNATSPLPPGLKPRSYWLAVGMGESRKNLALLMDVFRDDPDLCTLEHPLVLVGAPQWQRQGYQAQLDAMRCDGRVHDLGFVPLDMLVGLYARTTAFLMPSLYEGFGIPLVEALAAGAPAIAADNSSLPDVSGRHAVLCPADDARAWRTAMRDIMESRPDDVSIARARKYVSRFNEDATAIAALASLESI